MTKKLKGTLNSRLRFRHRARLREEVSEGLRELMLKQGRTKAWLARRLGVSPPRITKMLEGASNNFEIETVADVFLALGRSVHIVLGTDLDEMRLPVDEGDDKSGFATSYSFQTEVAKGDATLRLVRPLKEGSETRTTFAVPTEAPVAQDVA